MMLWHPDDHGMKQRPAWQRIVGRLFWGLVIPLLSALWIGYSLFTCPPR